MHTYAFADTCIYIGIHTLGSARAQPQIGLMGSLDVFLDFTSSAWKANGFIWLSSRLERTEMEG